MFYSVICVFNDRYFVVGVSLEPSNLFLQETVFSGVSCDDLINAFGFRTPELKTLPVLPEAFPPSYLSKLVRLERLIQG